MFKITFIGQAGLLFENNNLKILVDPYLSDSVTIINPLNYRRQPVDEFFLKIKPDVIICTHDHIDHTDMETLQHYLGEGTPVTFLAPKSVWEKVRKFENRHNYVLFNPNSEWTQDGVLFSAVKAEHSDSFAIGVIINDDGKKYYITGDTLYNTEILKNIPDDINTLFLPINGVGNNMNMTDAARFAKKVNAKYTVPIHFGLFDNLNPNDFDCINKIIPEIYKEINLK